MNKVPVQIRMAAQTHERVQQFATAKKLSVSDALRRLIERGLDVSATDSYDLAKTLAGLSAAVQQAADRLGVIESDTAQMASLIPDMKVGVDSVREWSEELYPHGSPLLKMACEALIILRLQLTSSDNEKYRQLGPYINGLYDVHMKTAQSAGATKGRISSESDSSLEG